MKTFLLIFSAVLIISCSADHYEAKAKIIERRVLEDNSLLIKYTFKAGDKIITDSVQTKNRVIPHDSIKVSYSASDPGNNTLVFK
jgi:hypothetical protein